MPTNKNTRVRFVDRPKNMNVDVDKVLRYSNAIKAGHLSVAVQSKDKLRPINVPKIRIHKSTPITPGCLRSSKSSSSLRSMLLDKNKLEEFKSKIEKETLFEQHRILWMQYLLKLEFQENHIKEHFFQTLRILFEQSRSSQNPNKNHLKKLLEPFDGYQENNDHDLNDNDDSTFGIQKPHLTEVSEYFQDFGISDEPRDEEFVKPQDIKTRRSSSGYSSKTSETEEQESKAERLILVKACESCGTNMTVKFDLDNLESTDSKQWIQYSCISCKYDKCSIDDREASNVTMNPEAKTKVEILVQNVISYYTEKLQGINAKHNQLIKHGPSDDVLHVTMSLDQIYSDQPEKDLLEEDMFEMIISKSETGWSFKSVKLWMQKLQHLKRARIACLHDLSRERDKIVEHWQKHRAKVAEDRIRRNVRLQKLQHQQQHCLELHLLLEELQDERAKVDAKRALIKEEEEEREKLKKQKQDDLEQMKIKETKERLREYKSQQNAKLAQEQEELEKDLLIQWQKKREKGLQDYIRVNFRRVLAEKRRKEAENAKHERVLDQMAKEARLESLRRLARKKLGIDHATSMQEQTFSRETESFRNRLKQFEEEKETMISSEVKGCRSFNAAFFGYKDDDIWADERVVVESILREQGLVGSQYAVSKLLEEAKPATRSRPDQRSQIELGPVEAL